MEVSYRYDDACQVYIKRNHTIAGACLHPQHVLKAQAFDNASQDPYSVGIYENLRFSTQPSCPRSVHIDDQGSLFGDHEFGAYLPHISSLQRRSESI